MTTSRGEQDVTTREVSDNVAAGGMRTGSGRERGQLKWETFEDPHRVWRTPDGVEHLRGLPSRGVVTGDMVARASNVFNSDLDGDGRGILFGTYVFDTDSAKWRGHFNGSSTAEGSRGTWDGYAAGQRLWGTFTLVGKDLFDLEWEVFPAADEA